MDDLDIINMTIKKNEKKVQSIIQQLSLSNIHVESVIKGNLVQDPAVVLKDGCHITIHLDGSLGMSKLLPDGCIQFYPVHDMIDDVIEDYKQVMKDA